MSLLIRQRLRQGQRSWQFFMLPHHDAFLKASPRSAHRMRHLTGFTGSSGTLLMTPSQDILFVDGRYVLQAHAQTEDMIVESSLSVQRWINQNMPQGCVLGVDPWVLSAQEMQFYLQEADKKGWQIKWDSPSSIDAIIPPYLEEKTKIEATESDRSFQEKCQFIFHEMEASSGKTPGALVLCRGEDIAWLMNLRSFDLPYTPLVQAYAIVEQEAEKFKGRIFTEMPRTLKVEDPSLSFHPLKELGKELQGGAWTYEPSSTPYGLLLYEARWQQGSLKALRQARSRKTPWEQHHIKHAHVQDGVAMVKFLYWLSKIPLDGRESEASAAAYLENCRASRPAYQGPSFPTISAFGPHSALIHYSPPLYDSKVLEEGLYLVDSGGQYHFGTTDITRTIWLGGRPSLKSQKVFTTVLQAHIHLATLILPLQAKGIQLDAAARSFLWQQGWDYPHSTGHGVGTYLSVHESPPALSSRGYGSDEDLIVQGMVFSNEPGYYEEGWGGVRLENVVMAVERKEKLALQTLSLAPFDRKLIREEELSLAHRQWLNRYHEAVYTTLAPFLEEERPWLFEQTRPL